MSVKETIKDVTDKIGSLISRDSEPEILDTLKKEHQEVTELLQKLTETGRAAERKSLLAKIAAALVPHTKAEEAVLYDVLIKDADRKAEQDGREGYFEHELASHMLDALKALDAGSIAFAAGAKVLKELVEHHVQEEERNVWSDARKAFSLDTRKEMNSRYLTAKAKVSHASTPMKTAAKTPAKIVAARAKPKARIETKTVVMKSAAALKKTPLRKPPTATSATHPKA